MISGNGQLQIRMVAEKMETKQGVTKQNGQQ